MPNGETVYESYEEAVDAAERIGSGNKGAGMITKVQNSPYGRGFVVRTFPKSFLLRPRLRERTRSVEYRSV